MKKCSKCGAEYDENISFCGKCGTALANTEETNSSLNTQENIQTNDQQTIQQQTQQPIQQPVQQPQYIQQQFNPQNVQNVQQPQPIQQPYPQQPQYSQPIQPQFVQTVQPQYAPQAQPQYVQPVQPQYAQPMQQQYYQQPVYAGQPVHKVKQPPIPMDPRDLLLKTAGSSKFLVGAIFHFAAFIMTFFSFFALSAVLSSAIGSEWIGTIISASEIEDLNNLISGSAYYVIILLISIPLLALVAGIIITIIGGKKHNPKAMIAGMIIMLVMLVLIMLMLVALPIVVIIFSYAGGMFTSWLLAIAIVWLAFTVFLFLPSILMDIKGIRILNGAEMEKYTFPVVPVTLVFLGIFIILDSFIFLITFQWLYVLVAICLGISCFIFSSVVKEYNMNALYAIHE